MKREDLFEAMEDIEEKYILQAGKFRKNSGESHSRKGQAVYEREIKIEAAGYKRTGFRIMAAAVAALIAAGAAVVAFGTRKDKNTDKKITNYFRSAGELPLPETVEEIDSGLYGSGDTLFVPVTSYIYNETEKSAESKQQILVTDVNGNVIFTLNPGENEIQISDIRKSESGDTAVLYKEYEGGLSENYYILKVDETYSNIVRKELKGDCEMNADEFLISPEGELLVSLTSSSVGFFDSDGNLISAENKNSRFKAEFFRTGSDYYEWYLSENGGTVIKKADFETHTFSDVCTLDFDITDAFDGYGDYDAVFSMYDGIYGYSFESEKLTEIINWLDSEMDEPSFVYPLSDDLIISSDMNMENNKYAVEVLKRVSGDELKKIQNKKVLTVALDSSDYYFTEAVKEFNSRNNNYRIHIEDYSKYTHQADEIFGRKKSGLSKLRNDIAEGRIPDIVIFNEAFDRECYSYSEAFEDLNKYISNDRKFNRSDFFENIMDAYCTDDKQYSIPLRFSLNTFAGKRSVIGDAGGLSNEKLFELSENMELFGFRTYSELLYFLLESRTDEFADFSSGTFSFDSEKFIKLITLVKKYGISFDEHLEIMRDETRYYEMVTGLYNNLYALEPLIINSTEEFFYNIIQKYAPADIVLTGIPGGDGSSVMVSADYSAAMMSSSENKNEAWNFIKILLSEDWQGSYDYFVPGFPVRKSAFAELTENAKEYIGEGEYYADDCTGESVQLRPVNDDDTAMLTDLIASVSRPVSMDSVINRIIYEETDKYFADEQTAEETAKRIQDEVSIFLREIK